MTRFIISSALWIGLKHLGILLLCAHVLYMLYMYIAKIEEKKIILLYQ